MCPLSKALHLIGQALLEEKSQLEAAADEEVAFDFSVKARGKWRPFCLGNVLLSRMSSFTIASPASNDDIHCLLQCPIDCFNFLFDDEVIKMS